MNDPNWHWWDLITPFVSAATAVVTGATFLFALISGRFKAMQIGIDATKEATQKQIRELHERVAERDVMVATLATNELHYSRRLDTIERSVVDINHKQDEQTQILYEIKGQTRRGA